MASKPPTEEYTPISAPAAAKGRSLWPLALTAVFIAILIAGTVIVLRVISLGEKIGESAANAPGKIASTLADAFRPKVSFTTTINSTLQSLKNDPKLVVLTASVSVEVTKLSEKNAFWGYVDLGKSQVRIKAYGNKVQYFVPMLNFSETNIVYDDFHKRVVVTVPPPQFDTEMVDVQSDPSRMEMETDLGWGRLDKFSGQFLRDQARTDLRPAVIREGRSELLQEKARSNARMAIKKMLEPMAKSLKPNIEVWVLFDDEVGLLGSQPLD